MTSIAVMQPYFFPYIGYYQLVQSVDQFVFFDDVNFFKKGYINRNSLLGDDGVYRFTIPVREISQNKKINEHVYLAKFSEFMLRIRRRYRLAPNVNSVCDLIEEVVDVPLLNVAALNAQTITAVFEYLDLPKRFSFSSALNLDASLQAKNRILEICKIKKAIEYVNAPGGRNLYNKGDFQERGVKLLFLNPLRISYTQDREVFSPNLSMIDVLMWNDIATVRHLLLKYELT